MNSTLPDQLVSLNTIIYLGHDDDKASEIWNKWTAQVPSDPVPESVSTPPFELKFIDFVIDYSHSCHDDLDADSGDDTKWHEVMDRYGINEDTQRALMDPAFRQVRLTETCQYWIRDTIELRYEALKEVREKDQDIERASTSHDMSGGEAGYRSALEVSQDTAMSKVALCSTNAPGTFTLYRGMDKSRLKKLFDRNGNLDNIQRLISQPPTDFCGREAAYYFVADRDIAMHYAFFAKRRSDASSPVVVHAAFQNSAIECLSEVEIQRVYWPSEEWQRLIFLSRKAQRLPTDLRKFKRAALIIGTIAGKPNTCYVNMSSHVDITEEFLFKNTGENEGFGQNAVQYVFRNEEGEELLEKAEIKVYPITTTEFSEWYRNAQGRS